jgi:hypothetical protein
MCQRWSLGWSTGRSAPRTGFVRRGFRVRAPEEGMYL